MRATAITLRARALIGAALVLVLGGMGMGGAAFQYLNAPMDATNRFFKLLAAQGPAAAYAQTSPAFRAAVTEPAFARTVTQAGLRGYRCVRWSSWDPPEFDAVRLTGKLELADGRAVVATMRVVRDEADVWRLTTLTFGGGGF